jgi:hypothetical protein
MCKEEEEEVDIKRSPVPLPDNATCTPVLVKVRSPQIIENGNVQANVVSISYLATVLHLFSKLKRSSCWLTGSG